MSDGAEGRGDAVLTTYRYLRLATVVLVVTLAAAVLLATARSGCWRNSISAFYHSSVGDVFVAVLCALGVGLIVYKGSSDTEDVLLNLAGFLAFVVAVVPTAPPPPGECGWTLRAATGTADSVRDSMWAILIAGAVAEIAALVISRRTGADRSLRPVAQWVRIAGWVIVVAGALVFVFAPDLFARHAHTVAATLVFAGIIGVAVASGVSATYTRDGARYARLYRVIATVMLATLIAVVVVHLAFPEWGHLVIVTEALLVAEFAAFWIVQTVELWNVVDRTDLYEGGDAPQML
ncbi:hypothetical protein [Rhodococcus gannanensis]|uniref:Diphosphate--fructose-6-phosphate 1-phosphotransferase n=1 Tax=Rhodococcus gannanensis TaxID=1960308 RepID=A0ABW4NX99_9NOCA